MIDEHTSTQEYSIHGIVNISVAGLSNQIDDWLNRFSTHLETQSDISIQMVESLRNEPIRYVELNRYGYSPSGFVMLTKGVKPKKVLIPLEHIGEVCVITCEKGVKSVPMLQDIIHLSAIQKGFLPLHASTFTHQGRTVIASGWPQGGKTSLLLAFTTHGAQYVSDDWTYINAQQQAYGIPLPVTIRSWQLEQLPHLKAQVSGNKNLKLQTIRGLRTIADFLTQPALPAAVSKLSDKVSKRLDNRANVSILPEYLFGSDFSSKADKLDMVLLTISHDSPDIEIEAVPSEIGLAQLVHMQMHEWEGVLGAYEAYHAAMPEKANAFLETLPQRLNELIQTRLKDLPVYRVYHPHPVNLDALYQSVLPIIKQ